MKTLTCGQTRKTARRMTWGLVLALVGVGWLQNASAVLDVRLKDIARIEGLDETEIIGYGVVVGLRGSGDKDIELTKRTMANILQNFQITLPTKDIKSKNVAVVMVTARIPPFHQKGDQVDVQVSSVGDASSLEGGVLLMCPLLDPNGKLTALAQGSLTVGGFSAGVGGAGGEVQVKNHTTVGRVPAGATIGRDRPVDFVQGGRIRYLLRHPDFTTAVRMVNAINEKYVGSAIAVDAATMTVRVPDALMDAGQIARFISGLETLRVIPDFQSKIIVNERTGTIVMGGDVRISDAIVAHGNLTVNVGSTLSTYMPAPFTEARPVVTEKVTTQTDEEAAKVMLLPATATVRDLADLLNQLGTTPRDLISILDALQKLGAIQMELVTM